jgi:hypothetical protein
MKFIFRLLFALVLGVGSMLALCGVRILFLGWRLSEVELIVLKTVGFAVSMGYYFSRSKDSKKN